MARDHCAERSVPPTAPTLVAASVVVEHLELCLHCAGGVGDIESPVVEAQYGACLLSAVEVLRPDDIPGAESSRGIATVGPGHDRRPVKRCTETIARCWASTTVARTLNGIVRTIHLMGKAKGVTELVQDISLK